MPSTSVAEQLKPYKDAMAFVAQMTAVRLAQGVLQSEKAQLSETQAEYARRLSDPNNRDIVADRRAFHRLDEASRDRIEAAERVLRDLESQSYGIEREAREAWIAQHGSYVQREHARLVTTIAKHLTAIEHLNREMAALLTLNAGCVNCSPGPAPLAVAPWLRVAREAGLVD